MFLDYEFGWARSLYSLIVFHVTRFRRVYIKGKNQPYKIIGDDAYPGRLWIYHSFKGEKIALFIMK